MTAVCERVDQRPSDVQPQLWQRWFDPIGLDELVADAALLTRVDRKYVLPRSDVAALAQALPHEVRVLEIAGRRDFGYRSTYLDEPGLTSFFTTGRDRRRRFKVRSRSYVDTAGSWLEVKTRGSRSTTVKQRLEHPDAVHGLTADGHAFVTAELAQAGVPGVDVAALAPVLVTAYRRTTVHVPAGSDHTSSRATVDLDLEWQGVGPSWTPALRPGGAAVPVLRRPDLAIVETKAGSSPSVVDRALWRLGHRPVSISKYGTGLAALRPDLPRLKWHRTLARHLGEATT